MIADPAQIDTATPDDRDDVVALWSACGLTRPWNDPMADYARALDGATSTILVTRRGGTLIGSVMVGHDGHRGWVYYLAVAPGARRGGLGRRLMGAAAAWLGAAGSPKIQLMVRSDNAAAFGFYETLGLERQDVVVFGRFLEGTGE